MEKVVAYIKRFVLGAFVLYGYNLIAANFNLVIPINFITIGLIGLLGTPAIFALIILKMFTLWGNYVRRNYKIRKILSTSKS